MKKIILFALLILSSFYCTSQSNKLVGHYSSPGNTFFNKIKYGRFIYCELELYNNNNFVFKTCAQVTQGKWISDNKILNLICDERKFIIDSFNHKPEYKIGTVCNGNNTVFQIESDILKSEVIINSKKYYFILKRNF